jgi:hypothetical protein
MVDVRFGGFSCEITHFQKIGLKAMDSAASRNCGVECHMQKKKVVWAYVNLHLSVS